MAAHFVRGFGKAAQIEDIDEGKEKRFGEMSEGWMIEMLSKHVTFLSEDLSVLSLDLSRR
jgi:hypothetical protein